LETDFSDEKYNMVPVSTAERTTPRQWCLNKFYPETRWNLQANGPEHFAETQANAALHLTTQRDSHQPRIAEGISDNFSTFCFIFVALVKHFPPSAFLQVHARPAVLRLGSVFCY
jgi:hypothetical protein